MKRIILVFALVLLATGVYSQKKKAAKATPSKALATTGNLSVELVKSNLYLFVASKTKKDTILLKNYTAVTPPTDCKITPFTVKGTLLNLVTWTESTLTNLKRKQKTV